jgi:uncharacterized protein YciI
MSFWVLEYRYADMDARARVRPDHLAYMTALHEQGTVVYAGPVGDGGGALVLIRAASQQDAQRVVDADPYTVAGVGTEHLLRPWTVVIGTAEDLPGR